MSSPHLTDDELGTALGRSVQSRVDDVPTLTPGFAGVERRARQITHRRRTLAAAAVGLVLVVGGIGVAQLADDGDTTSDLDVVNPPDPEPTPAVPDDPEPAETGPEETGPDDGGILPEDSVIPPLLTLDGLSVVRVDPDGSETVIHTSPRELHGARLGGSGVLVVQREALNPLGAGLHEVVAVDPDGTETVLSTHGVLAGLGVIDGTDVAFVGEVPTFADTDSETGDLLAVDLTTKEASVFIEQASGIEWGIWGVSVAADRVLTIGGDETGPYFQIHSPDGTRLDDLATPTDGRFPEYRGIDQPGPAPVDAALSSDGSTIWWLEDPGWEFPEGGGDALVIDAVRLRSLDVDTGEEGVSLEVPLPATPARQQTGLESDGEVVLVTVAYFDPDAQAMSSTPPLFLSGQGSALPLPVEPGYWVFAPDD